MEASSTDASSLLLAPDPARTSTTLKPSITATPPWVRATAFFVMGLGSWLCVTALFAEASYFVAHVPEGKAIFAQLDLAVQLSNVVPAALVLLLPRVLDRHTTSLVGVLFLASLATCATLAGAWDAKAGNSSVALLAGGFGAGVVGTTSMVSFFPLAGPFGVASISALSCGIGLCGLVAQLLAVAQGMAEKGPLRFTVTVYFLVILGFQLVGACGFLAVVGLERRDQKDRRRRGRLGTEKAETSIRGGGDGLVKSMNSPVGGALNGGAGGEAARELQTGSPTPSSSSFSSSSSSSSSCCPSWAAAWLPSIPWAALKEGARPLCIIMWTCAMQYGVPGLLPYLADPHESKTAAGSSTFWLQCAFFLGSALGRMGTAFKIGRSDRWLLLNVAQLLLFVYALVFASLAHHAAPTANGTNDGTNGTAFGTSLASGASASPPKPPLWLSIIFMTAFSYLHGMVVTLVFRSVAESPVLTRFVGLANQIGALLGSLVTFVLVSIGVFG